MLHICFVAQFEDNFVHERIAQFLLKFNIKPLFFRDYNVLKTAEFTSRQKYKVNTEFVLE